MTNGRNYSIGQASPPSLSAGNAGPVDYKQDYLFNNEIDMEQKFKPFNLEAAKAGAPVMTRDGRPARILAFDVKSEEYPVVAVVPTHDGKYESVEVYTKNGQYNDDEYDDIKNECDYDLVMAPIKHRAWVNVYKGGYYHIGSLFDTEAEAVKSGKMVSTYIATVPIEWVE